MSDMTFTQAAVIADELAAAMVEKGLKTPRASVRVASGTEYSVWLHWAKLTSSYTDTSEFFRCDDIDEAITKARAFVEALPTPMTTALNNHMEGIAKLVDAGRAAGIDDAYIAPLVVV